MRIKSILFEFDLQLLHTKKDDGRHYIVKAGKILVSGQRKLLPVQAGSPGKFPIAYGGEGMTETLEIAPGIEIQIESALYQGIDSCPS
jgi:hypothetical protein